MPDFQFQDKRVQKTKIDLFEAFFIILKNKSYKDIKITDIVSKANCSRATFYKHYNKKDDLLEDIIHNLFKEMVKAFRSTYTHNSMLDIQNLKDEPLNLLNHFIYFGDYYQLLLGKQLQVGFQERVTNTIIQLYMEEFEIQTIQDDSKVSGELLERYCGYGLVGLIIDWIKEDFPTEPKVFSKEIVKIFKYLHGTVRIKKRSYTK